MLHTFYDDLTQKGKWWLPGSAKKIDGILTVKGGDEIRVELFDAFDGMHSTERQTVIHGQTDGGTAMTLLDNVWAAGSYGSSGYARPTYIATICVFNLFADGRHDVVFHNLRLRFTDLESWAGKHDFVGTSDGKSMTVTYTSPEPISITIPDQSVTIAIDVDADCDQQIYGPVTLSSHRVIHVTPESPISFNDALRLISDLKNFFSLLTGKKVFLFSISGEVIAEVKAHGKQGPGIQRPVPCDVLFSQPDQQPRKPDFRLLFPLPNLANRFPQLLRNWFASLPALRVIYDVFFGIFGLHRLVLHSYFLHISQSIESYHRRTIGGRYISAEEFQPINAAIVAAIPREVGDAHREKLKSQIFFGNDFAFHKRLTHLITNLSDSERSILCENPKQFIKAIVDTRNYLTHLDDHPDKLVLENDQLIHAGRKLELLLILLFLKHIGFSSEEVLASLQRTVRFDLTPFVLERQHTTIAPETTKGL